MSSQELLVPPLPSETGEGLEGEGPLLLAGLADERFGVLIKSGQHRGRGRGRRLRRLYRTCRLAVLPSSCSRLALPHDRDISRGAAGSHPARLDGAAVDVECRFFVLGGAPSAEVVRGLETLAPGGAIKVAEDATGRLGDVEVERLAHVDPFLTAGSAGDQPGGVDLEGGWVALLDLVGDTG